MSTIAQFLKTEVNIEISPSLEDYLLHPFEDRWQNADEGTLEKLRAELMPAANALGNRPDARIETAVVDVAEMALLALLERRRRGE